MSVEAIEAEIRSFFEDAGGGKLTFQPDGSIDDYDSNWGFEPRLLAERIARVLAHKCANGASDMTDNDLQRPVPAQAKRQ